jgi:SAM-dependent methyltransferase
MSYDAISDFGLLYDSVPLYAARRDVAFYMDEGTHVDGPVLELGCGTGRTLLPIALAGKTVVGLDSSRAMLDRFDAKLKSQPTEIRERVTLKEGDIRDFDLGQRYRLITAPFRVLQHLTSIDDQLRCFAAVRRHLAPGSRFVFDVFNPRFEALVSADGQEHEDTPEFTLPDGRVMRRTARVRRVRWIDQVSEVELIYYVKDHERGEEQRHVSAFEMRWFLPSELQHILARSGFEARAVYGDFDRTPLKDGAPEQIVSAEAR